MIYKKEKYASAGLVTLEDLAKHEGVTNAVCVNINSRLRELTYPIENIKQGANIEFLSLNNQDAVIVYQTSLRYLIAYAINNLYPKNQLKFFYFIGRTIRAEIVGLKLTEKDVEKINKEMKRIVKEAIPIKRLNLPLKTAEEIYIQKGFLDKVAILKYRKEPYVNAYQCKDYINYMFGYLVPNTKYLDKYNLMPFEDGFLLRYPRCEFNGEIPEFSETVVYIDTLKKALSWSTAIGGDTIAGINKLTENEESIADFVNVCETRHNNMLCRLGDHIAENKNDIDLIAIAGPSSSGKTTFTNRVRIELLARGIHPVMISLDNYYKTQDQVPRDADGKPDFEHIQSLDIASFNDDLQKILTHKETDLYKYNFKLGKRELYKKVKLEEGSPIIIEGIHALNELMTPSIERKRKFKIYISPQTQIHIDNMNPIGITDLRLVRRIVRDMRSRNASPELTLDMWQSVRAGEFKWIYPFEDEANFVFNTELSYELAVLKKHVLKDLDRIPRDSKHFIAANRLVKFLKYFNDIPDNLVPANSLLREFIGGSSVTIDAN